MSYYLIQWYLFLYLYYTYSTRFTCFGYDLGEIGCNLCVMMRLVITRNYKKCMRNQNYIVLFLCRRGRNTTAARPPLPSFQESFEMVTLL